MNLFSIPASSTSCERSRSLQNIIHTHLRNRLKESTANKLMIIEWTMRKSRQTVDQEQFGSQEEEELDPIDFLELDE